MRDDGVRIRSATAADALLLAEMGARTFVDAFGADNDPDDLATHLGSTFGSSIQQEELNDPANLFLIARAGDEDVGYAKLRFGDAAPATVPGARPAELVRIYVEQQWVGRGVGSALMESCLAATGDRGFDAVWLSTWERNGRGIEFYRRWGFSEVGRQVFFVGRDAQDDLIMSRLLEAG